MNPAPEKVMDLSTAIARFVPHGAHISIGGFTLNRNPMAAVYELIRQKIRDLHLYAHSNGQGVDELIGGGCVGRVEIAYGGTGRFAPTCVRFRRAAEAGTIQIEDYSNFQMTLRFQAGAWGVPYLPVRSGMGSSIVEKWGFSAPQRLADPKLPDHKLMVTENPFGGWTDARQVVLVPAINPDVTIIHVQTADSRGTARIEGLTFADVEQAKAARRVILTCEELVEEDELRRAPDRNQIPFFCVDAVVPVPWGAYPTACYRHYDYDPVYLNGYREAARDEARYETYLADHIFSPPDHGALMARIGIERQGAIKADPRTGYAAHLDRR